MRKQAYMIATLIMIVTVAGLSSVAAQSSPNQMTADIPFAFKVGEREMPAGEYTVRCVNPSSDVKILRLSNSAANTTVLIHTGTVIGKAGEARLTFNRYGNRYFFAQAWLLGKGVGMRARKSRSEKAAANEHASIERATEMIALTRKR